MKHIKWERKVQELGRIQIPSEYLKTHDIEKNDGVVIEQTSKDLVLKIVFRRVKK